MRVPPSFTNSAVTPASRLFTSSMNFGGNDHSRPTMTTTLCTDHLFKLEVGSWRLEERKFVIGLEGMALLIQLLEAVKTTSFYFQSPTSNFLQPTSKPHPSP